MTGWEPPPEALRRVTVARVRDYLSRWGWVAKESPRPGLQFYEHRELLYDDGRPLQLSFPAADDAPGYPVRVLDLLESLSRLEGKHPVAVYREITGGADPFAGVEPVTASARS